MVFTSSKNISRLSNLPQPGTQAEVVGKLTTLFAERRKYYDCKSN